MLSFSSLVDFQSNSNWSGIGLKKEMKEKYRERGKEIQREREKKLWKEKQLGMSNHNRKTTCGSHIHCYQISQPLAIVTESARHL